MANRYGIKGLFGAARLTALLFLLLVSFPAAASADSIRGLLEFIYNNTSIDATDAAGTSAKIRNNGFQQRYNLAFDKGIYPTLIFSGGGQFEATRQSGTTDGEKNRSSSQRISPYLDLQLKNPFVSSGIGYRRREESAKSNGLESPKNILETYLANFGWHPSELPSLSVFYTKRSIYDEFRQSQDIETDNYTWISDYRAIKGLEINYNGNYNLVNNNILNAEVQSLTNSARIAYSGRALANRVFYQSSYSITRQESQITLNGSSGTFFLQQLATNGLFLQTTQPQQVTDGQLNNTPAVLNGNAQINLVSDNPSGTIRNNIGLGFAAPTQVSTLFLSVVSQVDGTNPTLRTAPTPENLRAVFNDNNNSQNAFAFDVYLSEDGTNWVQQPGATVTVGRNPDVTSANIDQVGFIVTFPEQQTSFVKVVQTPRTLPLVGPVNGGYPTDIDRNNILVDLVRAFRSVTVTSAGSSVKSSNLSGIYDMNVKVQLMNDPIVSYDMAFTFTHNKSDQSSFTTTYLLNNGLNYAKRLADIWNLSARVTDEVDVDTAGKVRNTVSYNAGVTVAPLPTLYHSLVYGGRTELFEGHTRLTNSIYQNNSAELYRGLNVNLGAGYTIARDETGLISDSIAITFGTIITPNSKLTLNINYQDQTSHQTGGGKPDLSSFSRSVTSTASYRLTDAIFLSGGYSYFMQSDKDDVTLQDYAVSWSPFRDGDLQFNFAFSESYNSSEGSKDRTISPSLRWNVRPGTTFDVSYSILDSTSTTLGNVYSESIGAQLRITF